MAIKKLRGDIQHQCNINSNVFRNIWICVLLHFNCQLFLAFAIKIVAWLLLLDSYQQNLHCTVCDVKLLCSHTLPKPDNGMRGTWLPWVYLLSWCWQLCICCSSCPHAACMRAQGPAVAPALRKCTVPFVTSPLPHETYPRTQRDST